MGVQALSSVGVIPDGNRRYAKKKAISFAEAYKIGMHKALNAAEWLHKYNEVGTVTFYALSRDNLSRPNAEVNFLLTLFEQQLQRAEAQNLLHKYKIKLNVLGDMSLLPAGVRKGLVGIEEETSKYAGKELNLLIGYDGRWEIVDAAKRVALEFKEGKVDLEWLNKENFGEYLYRKMTPPELIIRTSGTHRLSAFLTYQSAYSELYFLDKLWPEVEEQDVRNAVDYYYQVQRNFGK